MDEESLKTAIMEEASKDTGPIFQAEGINFNEILQLRLGYRNILVIDHLWEFTSLTKLELNNNQIEKMEGLDQLLNLTWLNLSFNSIQKIEGLESLRKLEVLNLCNNRISVIENMDTLEKITLFFIANNHLGQLDNVLYLRGFKNLRSINLCGNPVSKEDEYKFFMAAHFPNLMYLDSKSLDEKTKNEASIKYRSVLFKMKLEELQKQEATEAEQRQEAEVKLHTDAFVEFLNGSHLFKSMIKDDPEAETLRCVPEVAQLLQTFEQQMVKLCMQLFEFGLAEHKCRETEVTSFFSGQSKAVTYYQGIASQILANFEQQHRERTEELQQLSDLDLLKVKMDQCNDEIDLLCNSLMELEFEMAGELENIIKLLDTTISDMVCNFSETAQEIFVQCRDLEDSYYEKVREVAVATLESVAKDNVDEDLPDDVKMIQHDKMKWHRIRISDTHRYRDYLREQLEKLL
ncbi:dynein regulatory complex subunit 3 isoform X2 [Epinephelus moara]|uniref:dynein regulatory complex subunit 3 isoform X2 n=1 Tax=Epinephelus moara TaxID=300413 RepID=UPI00214E993C|nr:dynein regulatory complex subunit 3 isoform X2 [Epinephelus moara]